MARTNTPAFNPRKTHEGAQASPINPEQALRRSLLACLLWEKGFYESGEDVAERIIRLATEVSAEKVNALAVQARSEYNLRHAPLWLCVALARSHRLKAETLASTIQRADELSEFLSMYWKDGKTPLSAQVKKGLAAAFAKFDAYQLAKYDRENAIRLRDVLFMVHAKPKDTEQAAIWKQLVDGTLPSPDTWEVNLSAGADKRETWERLMAENKLGYLALLRNLRGMEQAGVPKATVAAYLAADGPGRERVLPFRFIAAARAVPKWEDIIEPPMLRTTVTLPKMAGKTVVLVDVSGSMDAAISLKSDLHRIDAACALAVLLREICEEAEIYSFSNGLAAIPARHGFALRDAIVTSQSHGGTMLGMAVAAANNHVFDRLIVFTDEQSHDRVPDPTAPKAYMINVAANENGVGYGKWTHIDGFSESIIRYVQELETANVLE